jgi:hypothetical protein
MTEDEAGVPEDEFVEGAGSLVRSIGDDPVRRQTVEDVLNRYTSVVAEPDVMRRLGFALNQVIGGTGGSFLAYYLGTDQPDEVLGALHDVGADPEMVLSTIDYLRRLQALFGYSVQELLGKMGRDPDDWEGFHREVALDVIENVWRIEMTITKVNGEEFRLSRSPDSGLRLAESVVRTLHFAEGTEYAQRDLETFSDVVTQFYKGVGYEMTLAPIPQEG